MSPKIKSRWQKYTTRILWRESSFGPQVKLSCRIGDTARVDVVHPGFFKNAIVEMSHMMREFATWLVGN